MRAFSSILLLLLLCACTKTHFGAPTTKLDPGLEITVVHAMGKRGHFHLVASVTNWTGKQKFVNPTQWYLRLPGGHRLENRSRSEVNLLNPGETEKLKMVFPADDVDLEHLPGAELVVGGITDHPGQYGEPIGTIVLRRKN
jgi:hypothetical protein